MGNKAVLDPLDKINRGFEERSVVTQKKIGTTETRADGLSQNVLMLVAQQDYVQAIEQIRCFYDLHPEYPTFRPRVERYVAYSIDLVNGIKAKRSLAGVKQLAAAKQKELYDRAMTHFEDLKQTLRKIELIESEVRLDDIRSTVWVIKALAHCTFAVLVFLFVIEVSQGVLESVNVVAEDYIGTLVDKIFNALGL